MTTFNVILSDNARSELHKIEEYITLEFHAPKSARNQVKRILKTISAIAVFPKLHRVRKKYADGEEVRLCPVDNYVIIYSVDDENKTVNISRIIYGKRNLDRLI